MAELPTGTVLLVVVALLCVIGLVMVGSASSVVSISLYGSPWAILIRECMWMAVGIVAFALAVRFDHRKLRRLSPLLLGITFLLLLVVLVPGLGRPRAGLEQMGRLRPVPAPAVGVDETGADGLRSRSDHPAAR